MQCQVSSTLSHNQIVLSLGSMAALTGLPLCLRQLVDTPFWTIHVVLTESGFRQQSSIPNTEQLILSDMAKPATMASAVASNYCISYCTMLLGEEFTLTRTSHAPR